MKSRDKVAWPLKFQVKPAERWQSTWQRLLSDIPETTDTSSMTESIQNNMRTQNNNSTQNNTAELYNAQHRGSVRRPKTATARIRYWGTCSPTCETKVLLVRLTLRLASITVLTHSVPNMKRWSWSWCTICMHKVALNSCFVLIWRDSYDHTDLKCKYFSSENSEFWEIRFNVY